MGKIVLQYSFLLLSFIINNISCQNTQNGNLIIPSDRVGGYKLGEKLIGQYNNQDVEIKTTGKDNIINEIIVKSSKFKTIEGFGVGSELKQIELRKGKTAKEMSINKGDITIGSIGNGLFYDNIWYIDEDKNGIVDEVWLFHTK